MALIKRDEDFDLPQLKARPLWARLVLSCLFILLIVLVIFDQLIGDGIVSFTTPAVLCGEVAPGQAVYRLQPAESEVRYQVDENLLNDNTINTPIARTNAIDGYIVIDFTQPHKSQICDVVVNISQLRSDNERRDRIVRIRYLNTIDYPQATFKPTRLLDFPDDPEVGDFFTFRVKGDLTIKATTASVIWNVRAKVEHDRLEGSADTVILMSTYNVGPVNIAGFVQSSDDVSLVFDFVAQRINPAEVLAAP